jgi:uncharacterized protein (TIGR03790 family)
MTRWLLLAAAFLGLCAGPVPALAQSADNVLLVVNAKSEASQRIADHYARARGIDQDHVVRVETTLEETVSRFDYVRQIEQTIANWMVKRGLQDRILYIVLTKGVPLRVSGTDGREGTVASVDSELTLLYRKLAGSIVSLPGAVPNPYFLGDRPIRDAKPFSRMDSDIYLVTRLDGYTVEDAIALIDRAARPSPEGLVVLDMKSTLVDRGGDAWLRAASERLKEAGLGERVILEMTTQVVRDKRDVLGYASWGSNDPANKTRDLQLSFVPGALAAMFVSTDGRTFKAPPADWELGNWNDKRTWFGGSPQSLAGDLVRSGVTGVAAHVAEPYLDSTIRPQILFPAYVAGMNLAESFFLAMPDLSWQTIVVGDPLCAPFPRRALTNEQIHKGIDPVSEMPALLTQRRLANAGDLNRDALKLAYKAEVRGAADDKATAQALLEKATALEPRLNGAQLILAQMFEQAGDYGKAVERYRRIVENSPNDIIALNNLAYALAERQKAPAEALPVAQKAYRLAPTSAPVIDTLGWVYHLLGDDQQARVFLQQATRVPGAPGEVHFHYAVILNALGDRADAAASLARALQLAPGLKERPDVQALEAGLAPR